MLPNQASGVSFPQLRFVIVGTQNSVAMGTSLSTAIATLYNVTTLPTGLAPPGTTAPASPEATPVASPGASPTPTSSPSASAPAGGYTAPELAIISDLVTQEASLKADYASGNLSAAGQAQAAINSDISQLDLLLAAGGVGLPTPSVTPAAASPPASP